MDEWVRYIQIYISQYNSQRLELSSKSPNLSTDVVAFRLHQQVMIGFYGAWGVHFRNHSMCLSCLRELPEHPLPCGHILCTSCVQSYGASEDYRMVEVSQCPVCGAESPWSGLCQISFKPALAGVRVLSLDG